MQITSNPNIAYFSTLADHPAYKHTIFSFTKLFAISLPNSEDSGLACKVIKFKQLTMTSGKTEELSTVRTPSTIRYRSELRNSIFDAFSSRKISCGQALSFTNNSSRFASKESISLCFLELLFFGVRASRCDSNVCPTVLSDKLMASPSLSD